MEAILRQPGTEDRVGGGLAAPVLPHHRTCALDAFGGSQCDQLQIPLAEADQSLLGKEGIRQSVL